MRAFSYFLSLRPGRGTTIRTKVGILITFVIGLISLFILLYFPARQEEREISAVADKAQSIVEMTAFIISPALSFEDVETLEEALRGARINEDLIYVIVVDAKGVVVANFNTEVADESSIDLLKGDVGISQDGLVYRTVQPILHDGDDIGRLYLGLSLAEGREEINRSRRTIAIISFVVFVIGMIALFGINTIVTRPLSHMVETAERISQGDMTRRASVGTQVEVAQLAGQIEQVILNLVVNARDAMPEGGRLTIETANIELDEAYAMHHRDVQPGAYVMCAVSDTGTGMDAETRSRIFDPFYTTKEKGKGTGLGLSTVYGIVKQSEGHIGVDSKEGRGTRFEIFLPRVSESCEAATPSQAVAENLRGTETILLVEDDDKARNVLSQILREQGYEVLEADDGSTALELHRKYAGAIQLVVVDVVMPVMNGPDLAKDLAATHPDLKVLFISGYTDNAIVSKEVLEPGLNLLQKPFVPEALTRKVREVLDA